MEKCDGCMHGFCGGAHGGLRWVLGIIVLLLVFWFGMRIGELKSRMYGGYGDYYMHRSGMMQQKMMYGGAPVIMYYGGMDAVPATMPVPDAE